MLLTNRHFSVFRTAARGMEAQRIALGAASDNIANARTTRTEDGTPYALKQAVHEAPAGAGGDFGTMLTRMRMQMDGSDPRHLDGNALLRRLPEAELGPRTEVQEVQRTRLEYDPTHPDANEDGYVEYPDINVVEEMTNMISANRVYEANLQSVQAAKEMIKRTLEI